MKNWLLFVLCLSSFTLQAAPLPASKVFQWKVEQVDPNSLKMTWQIQEGYYLYKDRIQITTASNNIDLGPLRLPESQSKNDKLNHTISIYKKQLVLPVNILGRQPGDTILNVSYQGCSESGFCYPPEKQVVKLSIDKDLAMHLEKEGAQKPAKKAKESSAKAQDTIGQIFTSHHWPVIFIIFFGLGLLLSFTPCILPMIPVLSGIVVGHGKDVTTRKAFFLSLSYVLSMSLTYAIAGAIVALLGANIQISMQSPWTISIFSFIFLLLALSMFGFYEFKLPQSWQSKIAGSSRKQRGGHYLGAAVMGCLSTLILSPCVTAPLIGVLTYIAQTGNVLLGSLTLFVLSLGMGAPLLLIGTSAGKWLPEAGPWMNGIKAFFGIMMLAIAIYLMGRILPPAFSMALWAILLIFSGIYSGALTAAHTGEEKFYQGIGIITLGYGLLILIGLSMGGTNPLLPLASAQLKAIAAAPAEAIAEAKSLDDVKQALAQAKAQGKPVMLDFYADWCTSCKYMEATTFQDEKVKESMKQMTIVKINVTANSDEDKAILQYFNVIAPPTFVFYNAQGEPLDDLKITGEQSAEEFLDTLKQIA